MSNQDVIEVELASPGAQEQMEHVPRLGTVTLYGEDFKCLAENSYRWLSSNIIDAALTLAAGEA